MSKKYDAFKCPHCSNEHGLRIQGPDDLIFLSDTDEMQELWQCDECDGYFILMYKFSRIVPLLAVK